MKEIIDFLGQSPAFYVGTVDRNDQPRVRPFSLVFEWEGKLTFGTSTEKNVYAQLKNNPNIEICSFSPASGQWMRITGKVKIFRSIEANRRIFEVMPDLKKLYGSEDNPNLICFSIDKGVAATYGFESMNRPVKIKEL